MHTHTITQAQHAERSAAAAIAVMPTTFFRPSSVGEWCNAMLLGYIVRVTAKVYIYMSMYGV